MFKLKQLAGAVACALAVSNAPAMLNADGNFGGASEGYQFIFETDFGFGGGASSKSTWAFGTDPTSKKQFIYFAAPTDFVDNTYGTNSTDYFDKKGNIKGT